MHRVQLSLLTHAKDAFIPFDLEALWSGILVLLIARIVDASLCATSDSSLQMAHMILEDMTAKGNMVAACRKSEMEHLDMTLQQLATPNLQVTALVPNSANSETPASGWNMFTQADYVASDLTSTTGLDVDDVLNGQHLEAIADTLDTDSFYWFGDIFDGMSG